MPMAFCKHAWVIDEGGMGFQNGGVIFLFRECLHGWVCSPDWMQLPSIMDNRNQRNRSSLHDIDEFQCLIRSQVCQIDGAIGSSFLVDWQYLCTVGGAEDQASWNETEEGPLEFPNWMFGLQA